MHFEEVHVQHVVLHGVELRFLDDGLVVNTVDFDVYEVDVGRINKLVDFFFAYYEVDGYGLAVSVFLFSVEHAGHVALLAHLLGGLLAEYGTRGTADCNLLHCLWVL